MLSSALFIQLRPFLLGLLFIAIVALVFGLSEVVMRNARVRSRLDLVGEGGASQNGSQTLRGERNSSEWKKLVDRIEKMGISLVDTNNVNLRRRLIAAGYMSPEAPKLFTLFRLVLTFALPAIFVITSLGNPEPPAPLTLYMIASLLAVSGLYMPNLYISAKAARRQEEIVHGFPDALDLMLVCVEAGLGLEAAMDRVGRELALSHPLVSAALGKVVLELRAGRSRQDALRRMADDVDVDEIRSFATLLIQSDQLGSSVGQTLRVYAAEMREKRRMRAEEKAHRLPVLLSVPLVACMLPVMIGVLMLPAVVRVVRDILPVMTR
ncbi:MULTISPECIES: type II secretion system F family protein [Sphingobium]|jgi:tight adherence protein C|uniref:Type II secretion system F family protein n=1 Tax=Sphingobium fuliginis (strain ATCC 27551) TaxID=336203 RepID=A0A292ZFN1_SPHSA|nr:MULTISPECIES: type II secretion system F family protein [Sphingobium]MCB4859882.1 type II secretion system F family protein [Sphingobium sp. PNB]QOT72370.1 type II secretion system F family protein [Sphingobium fuliginis]GAY21706.1 type II/IV secretion system protein TadC [Sphingobium fuliginis]